MDKLKMHTSDIAEDNIKKIGMLFPNCLTERVNEEGKTETAIDFDKLRQELSKEIVDGGQERYQFTWPGKREAIRLANTPSNLTLRPDRESSVDFDNTENLYIEGDNLEVLKLLREDYLGKVKMIYIDPPYNTGNDFVYEDDFSQTSDEFRDRSGMFDADGNMILDRYAVNSESNGRFHTDWLNMIYPRLKVARDLLTEDGVIFISIDDNEVENLRKVCDEVFGECNFVATVIWQKIHSIKNDARYFSDNHEYGLCYAKSLSDFHMNLLPRTEQMDARYKNPDNDLRGPWQSGDLVASGERSNGHYPVISPISGKVFDVPQGKHWVYAQPNLEEMIRDNRVWFGADGNSFPRKKRFLSEVQEGRTPSTLWLAEEVGHNQTATRELKELFNDNKFFDFPKPVTYLRQITQTLSNSDSIILDFFSGSATTAHAVMQLNAEDGGNRKFIMVQLPEKTEEKSEAYKAGYKTICEIGEERIRRAGKVIKDNIQRQIDSLSKQLDRMLSAKPSATASLFSKSEQDEMRAKAIKEQGQPLKDELDQLSYKLMKLDTGFRVLKLDSSNMQEVYYTPEDSGENTLFEDNVKPDRSAEDLLFQVMLECNLPLSAKIEKKTIEGKEVFNVNDGYLIACFDKDVNETVITEVAKQKPYYFVMRDASLSSDNVADNFEQIFNAYSKDTIRRIL